MKLFKEAPTRRGSSRALDVTIRLDGSICYDFVVSLRALFNPRTYRHSRGWAAAEVGRLGPEVAAKGEFLFGGFDTALGYGAARLVPRLAAGSTPLDLARAVAETDPVELALYMLDTGETGVEELRRFRDALDGGDTDVDSALDGLAPGWATRCRRVLRHPEAVKGDLVEVLQTYDATIYQRHSPEVAAAIAGSLSSAQQAIEVLAPLAAVEQLTGGYTFAPSLGLRHITLAPSVFVHPFMSTRIDEGTGEALIVYGIASDVLRGYEPTPQPTALVAALKALSDPNRLTILRLLAQQPRYTSDVVAVVGLSHTTVHHHLAQLRSAGLVRQQRDRHGMEYSVRHDSVLEVARALQEWVGADETSARESGESKEGPR